jgi:hypothetical protein
MQHSIMVGLLALGIPTVIATAVILAPGTLVRTWVRRVFLVVINLSPWITGTWRKEFSTRETFLAARFLSLVLVLIGLEFVPRDFLM